MYRASRSRPGGCAGGRASARRRFQLATLLWTIPRALFTGSLAGGTGPLVPCATACPANPFQVADAPGVADAFVRVALALALVSAAGLAATFVRRLRAASRPERRELVAVASTTFPFLPALVLVCLGALLQVSHATMVALGWVFAAAAIVFSLGFLAALIQAELFAGRALRRLLLELAGLPSPPRWRGAVAAALDDPSLRLGYWDPARYVFREPDGATLERPAADDGRRFTLVEHEGRPVAAMTTGEALGDHPELLAAAAQATLIAVRTGHLEGELRDSRRRLLDAGTTERRRIQRDLHDSAQQRLVALRVHLELAAADLDGPPESRAALRGLGAEVDEALAEVRRVASGLYPVVLERQGVVPALRSACAHTRLPIRFVDEGVGRHSATIESTLYFCCLEAVQNAAKHAGPDAEATVRLGSCDVGVWFCVEDDGVGFAYPPGARHRPRRSRGPRRGARRDTRHRDRARPRDAGHRALRELTGSGRRAPAGAERVRRGRCSGSRCGWWRCRPPRPAARTGGNAGSSWPHRGASRP